MQRDPVSYKVFPLEETDPAYIAGLRYFVGIIGSKGKPIPRARVGTYYSIKTAQEVKDLITNAPNRSVPWEFLESTDTEVEKEIDPCDESDEEKTEEDYDECLHEAIDCEGEDKWIRSPTDLIGEWSDWHYEDRDHD